MTIKINVRGGTAREGDPSLCGSCRFARVVKGQRQTEEIVDCRQLQQRVTFRVASCSVYVHQSHPSLWHMEDIAWVLRTDTRRRQIGFVRARDLKLSDRHILDQDEE